ncbi:MAG: ASCH domain-containing protein [Candidatus Paralactobacillus gallistercoris]|uniref:ASCH domain-containing protein n=1 Tax=Candidatus Paralactobacillus gallistercoris TaxID=2838724 RepID=A0A948TIN6_9LACO|nr:ASCH domain-containing protein [Candidatus Paralactobacillus gallistercoris]
MMALSIHPEYAWQIFIGKKPIEYRSWRTNYRGPLLICATAQRKRGYISGHALCVVNLIGIETYGTHDFGWQLAPFTDDNSYWITPFPVKGQLKLFNVDDQLIHSVPWHNLNSTPAQQWWQNITEPLRY